MNHESVTRQDDPHGDTAEATRGIHMPDHYPYEIATRTRNLTLIWQPGEGDAPDEFAVDQLGGLLTFHDLEALRNYCDRNQCELVEDGGTTLDLDVVRQWADNPDRVPDPVSPGLLLEAWNFFEDLSHTLKAAPPLPALGPIHDSAYEKIFGGETWTIEETTAVRDLLHAGLHLWEQAVHGTPFTRPEAADRHPHRAV
ncbi:hypothetical protein [Streptomyces sp. NPDC048410]|uniref:hypothetical protein n=1 Tax=Streptomyces sp. NPDC048410 TaxID=3365545 RepID=UPI003720B3C5